MSIADEIAKDRENGAKLLEKEYKEGLISFAKRFCADDSDAEALVYRTFAEVVARIDGYTEKQAFFGWMCKILLNCRANETRRKSNSTVIPMAELPDVPDDNTMQTFEAIDANILREAVEKLPPSMKEAVVLHYFMEQPIDKVATLLSLPSGTVKSRLHYARILLGQRLGAGLKKPATVLAVLAFLVVGVAATVIVNAIARPEVAAAPKYARVATSQPANLDTVPIETGDAADMGGAKPKGVGYPCVERCSASLDVLDTRIRLVAATSAGSIDTVVRCMASETQLNLNDIEHSLVIIIR